MKAFLSPQCSWVYAVVTGENTQGAPCPWVVWAFASWSLKGVERVHHFLFPRSWPPHSMTALQLHIRTQPLRPCGQPPRFLSCYKALPSECRLRTVGAHGACSLGSAVSPSAWRCPREPGCPEETHPNGSHGLPAHPSAFLSPWFQLFLQRPL